MNYTVTNQVIYNSNCITKYKVTNELTAPTDAESFRMVVVDLFDNGTKFDIKQGSTTHDVKWITSDIPQHQLDLARLISDDISYLDGETLQVTVDNVINIERLVPYDRDYVYSVADIPVNILLLAILNGRRTVCVNDDICDDLPFIKIVRHDGYVVCKNVDNDSVLFGLDFNKKCRTINDLDKSTTEWYYLSRLIAKSSIIEPLNNHMLIAALEIIKQSNANTNIIDISKVGVRADRIVTLREFDVAADIVVFDKLPIIGRTTIYKQSDLDPELIAQLGEWLTT